MHNKSAGYKAGKPCIRRFLCRFSTIILMRMGGQTDQKKGKTDEEAIKSCKLAIKTWEKEYEAEITGRRAYMKYMRNR